MNHYASSILTAQPESERLISKEKKVSEENKEWWSTYNFVESNELHVII